MSRHYSLDVKKHFINFFLYNIKCKIHFFSYKPAIYLNTIQSMATILQAMDKLGIPFNNGVFIFQRRFWTKMFSFSLCPNMQNKWRALLQIMRTQVCHFLLTFGFIRFRLYRFRLLYQVIPILLWTRVAWASARPNFPRQFKRTY